MKKYINLVKDSFNPTMTYASEQILIKYYTLQRSADARNASRTTIRLLESLVRIAQAHARLMFRTLVLPVDAITAIIMIEASMLTASLVKINAINQFPDDPESACIILFKFSVLYF